MYFIVYELNQYNYVTGPEKLTLSVQELISILIDVTVTLVTCGQISYRWLGLLFWPYNAYKIASS